MKNLPLAVGFAIVLLFAGCASVPADPAARAEFRANHDPLEPLNRRVFAFNLEVDRLVFKPLARGYQRAIPEKGRDALRNFINNLGEPVIFGNDLFQARWHSAGTTAGRFLSNTTIGFAGFHDWAKSHGLPRQSGDFGQTLHRWGFGEGPYLIVPIAGPSNPRDLVGSGVDVYIDPFRYIGREDHYPTAFTSGRAVVSGVDERARNLDSLDELQRSAIDFYASFRSLFRQNRAAQLRTGPPNAPPEPDSFYEDPGAAPTAPSKKDGK